MRQQQFPLATEFGVSKGKTQRDGRDTKTLEIALCDNKPFIESDNFLRARGLINRKTVVDPLAFKKLSLSIKGFELRSKKGRLDDS